MDTRAIYDIGYDEIEESVKKNFFSKDDDDVSETKVKMLFKVIRKKSATFRENIHSIEKSMGYCSLGSLSGSYYDKNVFLPEEHELLNIMFSYDLDIKYVEKIIIFWIIEENLQLPEKERIDISDTVFGAEYGFKFTLKG